MKASPGSFYPGRCWSIHSSLHSPLGHGFAGGIPGVCVLWIVEERLCAEASSCFAVFLVTDASGCRVEFLNTTEPSLKIDPSLVERAGKGDPDAFEEIVRLTHSDMFGLAYRLLGNEDDARDVLQDAYLRVYRSLKKFRGDAQFSTWMYRIVANTAYTYMRKRQKHRAERLDGIEEPESESVRPEDASTNTDLRERLKQCLLALPPDQRVVVVMKDIYDLPHEDIAKELGISVTAAKVRLHRARKRLRASLESEGAIDAVS